MPRRRRVFAGHVIWTGVLALGALLAPLVIAWGRENPQLSLRILREQEVPSSPSPALNLRFASDETVYLSRLHDGVTEVSLDETLTARRQPIPDRDTLHMRFPMMERLAVSPQFFAVASLMADYGFRPRTPAADGTFRFTRLHVWSVASLDLFGDRLLLLGDPTPRALAGWQESKGGIAWIGPLSSHPERDLKPFLYDVPGAPPLSLLRCMSLELGAVRFLPDGSYVVVPGVKDGVYLYSKTGTLLHTWKNQALGLDAPDCADMDQKREDELNGSYPARFEFLNRHRVIEEILPLAEGPGLLIRSVVAGKVRWALTVLHGDQVTSYPVPITGDLPYDRLRADVRGGRLAFLRTWHGFGPAAVFRPGHLYLAEFATAAAGLAP